MTKLVVYFSDEIPPELLKEFGYKSVEELQVHLLEENNWDILKVSNSDLKYDSKIKRVLRQYPNLKDHLTPYQKTLIGSPVQLSPADSLFFSFTSIPKLKGQYNFFTRKIEDVEYIVIEKYKSKYQSEAIYSDIKLYLTKWWANEFTDKELTTWQDFEQVEIGVAYRGGSGYGYGLTELKLD
jgi:hypothetical protein